MPIGKNAIKRVTNNGYSNVKTTAPDMDNSVVTEAVAEPKKPATVKKTTASVSTKTTKTVAKTEKKPTVKKPAAPKKSMETEPELAPVKTLEKVIEKSTDSPVREGESYINLGGALPYYLL